MRRRGPAHEQMHLVAAKLYVLENEPGASRQQLLRTHRPPFRWPGELPGRVRLPEASRTVQGRCQDSVQQSSRGASIPSARNVCQSHIAMARDTSSGSPPWI